MQRYYPNPENGCMNKTICAPIVLREIRIVQPNLLNSNASYLNKKRLGVGKKKKSGSILF